MRRADRYRWITDEIIRNIDIKWCKIDTFNKSIDEVYAEVKELLNLDKSLKDVYERI
nr:hypothetical protein [Clostridiales bacterium]